MKNYLYLYFWELFCFEIIYNIIIKSRLGFCLHKLFSMLSVIQLSKHTIRRQNQIKIVTKCKKSMKWRLDLKTFLMPVLSERCVWSPFLSLKGLVVNHMTKEWTQMLCPLDHMICKSWNSWSVCLDLTPNLN